MSTQRNARTWGRSHKDAFIVFDPHRVSRRIPQVLEKLRKSIEDGQYYEAQQMYKTLYHRHKSRGKKDDAVSLLQVSPELPLAIRAS